MAQPSTSGGCGPQTDRYLCICADDFGMSEGINAAVLDLADRGKISATGCMVRRDAWGTGMSDLREIRPRLIDVGLHLDLSRPLQGETFEQGLSGLILKSYLGLLRPDLVRAEIRDQLARFEDGLGRPPAFVDGHRHVHQLPVVRDMLTEEIATRYDTPRPWIRNTAAPGPRRTPWSKADVVFALGGTKLLASAASRNIPTSRGLLGVYGFTGSAGDYWGRLLRWIGDCRTGDVLMCHPSRGASADPFDAARRNEYAVLRTITFPIKTTTGTVFLAPLSRLSPTGELSHV
ncbi:ChbG/HpnK family deacetylase [Variovorax paradoxus]|nr:ChbG/HpnK family deacetylase [Variovorax paradoxus]MBT2304883.1 ChbG/HpnK family deacetylase [Variovorax paradoxus]